MGKTYTLQQLVAQGTEALRARPRDAKVVPVLIDLAPLAHLSADTTAIQMEGRLAQMIYKALALAIADPFVQSHAGAVRPAELQFKANRSVSFNPWGDFTATCQALWRALVHTQGSCRCVWLFDNADVLLAPRLVGLQTLLYNYLRPPPAPPAPAEPKVDVRAQARRAPRKGVPSGTAGVMAAARKPGPASRHRRHVTVTDKLLQMQPRLHHPGLRNKKFPQAPAEAPPPQPAAAAPAHKAAPPAAAKGLSAWGSTQLGELSVDQDRLSRHLPDAAERPLAMVFAGGIALLKVVYSGRKAHPLWQQVRVEGLKSLHDGGQVAASGIAPALAEPLRLTCLTAAGGHPLILQTCLQAAQRLAKAAEPVPDAVAVAAATELAPFFAQMAQQLEFMPAARPRQQLLYEALLQAPEHTLTAAQLHAVVGQRPVRLALDMLQGCGLATLKMRGDASVFVATCRLFNAYYAANLA